MDSDRTNLISENDQQIQALRGGGVLSVHDPVQYMRDCCCIQRSWLQMSLEWILCTFRLLKLPSYHVLHGQLFLSSFWQLQDLQHRTGVFFKILHVLWQRSN